MFVKRVYKYGVRLLDKALVIMNWIGYQSLQDHNLTLLEVHKVLEQRFHN